MELVTLVEKEQSRTYHFIEFDERTKVIIHKELENRNGKILMRSRVKLFGTLS